MKCPSCGAETRGNVCEFCGSEMPQDKTTIHITNNYYGNVSSQNTDGGKCPKCCSNKIRFEREKIATATQTSSRRNTIGTGRKKQSVSQSTYRTIGLCQDCGHTWNPNNRTTTTEKKGAPMWLWVLGWICIFPIPLTILLLRKKL